MYICLNVKYPLFFSDINQLVFSRQTFKKKFQIPNFMNIRPVGAELFHADGGTDGWTDMTKLIIVFRNFANAPKTVTTIYLSVLGL